VRSLPSDGSRLTWESTLENLIGPITAIAIEALGRSPDVFLSQSPGGQERLGVVVREFLGQAAKTGAGTIVTVSSLTSLFQSSLELMAKQPDLIEFQVDEQTERLFGGLLDSLGRANSEGNSFGEGALISIVTAVLRSMQGAAPSSTIERGGDIIPHLLDSVLLIRLGCS
jgi:hypothetical protein